MGFRDDREAMRARIEHLEAELRSANEEKPGLVPAPPQRLQRALSFLLGGPTVVRVAQEIDAEVDEAGLARGLEVLRAHFGVVGQVTRVGSNLAWESRGDGLARRIEATIAPVAGGARVRLVERLDRVATTLFGPTAVGVFGFSVPVLALQRWSPLGPWVTAAAFLALSAPLLAWTAYRRVAVGRRRQLAETCALVSATVVSEPRASPRVRISREDPDEARGGAEQEAEPGTREA